MINPDNTIKYIPEDDSESVPEERHLAPVKPTDTTSRDFRKMLGKSQGSESKKKKTTTTPFSTKLTEPTEPSEPEASLAIEGKTEKEDEENASQGVFNVFDLSKKSEREKSAPSRISTGSSNTAKPTAAKAESPNDLFKRMSSPAAAPKESAPPVTSKKSQKDNKSSSIYHTEQDDLSYVNPMAVAAMTAQSLEPSANYAPKVEPIHDMDPNLPLLIEQIVKQMYTVQKEGQTDTVMTLQYPPVFKDAKLTLSAFDTAKGQFNITFENLTQQAQKILENQTNKQSLFTALEQKGYNVHIYIATTAQIENVNLPEQQSSHDKEGQRQGGGGSSQQERQQQG